MSHVLRAVTAMLRAITAIMLLRRWMSVMWRGRRRCITQVHYCITEVLTLSRCIICSLMQHILMQHMMLMQHMRFL